MNTKTVAEWDVLEASKLAELEQLKAKKRKADARRADAILEIGEAPDDKNAKKALEEIEVQRRGLAVEIESVEALLGAIPERRKFSRADEIEAEIKSLQALKDRLIAEAPKIDAAAEAFVLATKEYFLILCEIKKRNGWALEKFVPNADAKYSIPFFMEKHGMVKPDPRVNRKSQVDLEEDITTITFLEPILRNMRESAKQLRGEKIESAMGYCPHCYSAGRYASGQSNKIVCTKCMTTISE